jgi:predicted Zn-dependent peptidase
LHFVITVFTLLVCGNLLHGQEIQNFKMSNGLEVRTLHLANSGIVHARLVFSWTEGTSITPIGTSWIMSKTLPELGSNGMGRAVFQNSKDQAGILSQISAGRTWLAWIFDAEPANADLMIQFLADEALRPTWPRSGILPNVLEKANRGRDFKDAVEEAIYNFKTGICDPNTPQLPSASIGQNEFVTMWAANVRRPEKATLQITGDLESISILRLVHQHFGPWVGIRTDRTSSAPTVPRPPKRTVRPVLKDGSPPEVWAGWNLEALSIAESQTVLTLLPWLLHVAMLGTDEIISSWEIDPRGRWLRVAGHPGLQPEKLEFYITALINRLLSQESLDKATKAMYEYNRSNALYPARALEQENLIAPPTLDDMQKILSKCMRADNLVLLLLAPGAAF